MLRVKAAGGILVGVILLLGLFAGARASMGPKAQLHEITYDFGKVFEDRALSHTFQVKNTGDAPLVIKYIDPACACTVAEYDHRIPPGKVGRITLTIKPYSVLRQFNKTTEVVFNDPRRPSVILTLKGYGKPFIEIIPSHIIHLRGPAGQDLRGQVKFISHLPEPWRITDVKTNIPQDIDVWVKVEKPGRIYLVQVRNKMQKAGTYGGIIQLANTSSKRPRLILRVFGELSAPKPAAGPATASRRHGGG